MKRQPALSVLVVGPAAAVVMVVVVLLLLGSPARGDPRNAGATGPSGEPTAGADRAAQIKALLAGARRVRLQVSRIRGLWPRRRIAKEVLSRGELKRRVQAILDEQYTAQELAAEAAVWRALGVWPAGLGYREAILDLLLDQVAGFYDPKRRTLYLADWLPLALQRPALAHELCHALQDQRYRLRRLVRPQKDNTDRQLARAALVEGDCTGVMLEVMLAPRGLDLSNMPGGTERALEQALGPDDPKSALARAPELLRETTLFPYTAGLRLVQQVRRRHDWRVVGRMFRRPPESTEQVLHYDKYWGREHPVRVTDRKLPALEDAGYRVLRRDVLGEAVLGVVLRLGVGREVAARAAEGWGGDRLVAYAHKDAQPDPPVLVHLTTWDSDLDAAEYVAALRHGLVERKLVPDPAATAGEPTRRYRDSAGRVTSVQVSRGRHVLALMGVPAALHDALVQDVWKRWRVNGRRAAPRPPVEKNQ